jgi:hypothetical protein
MNFGPIELDEIKLVKFNFLDEAGEGAVLSSPSVVCTTHKGVDAGPAAVLVGVPTVVGSEVHQKIQPGIVGVTYKLRATVMDSAGLKHGMTGYVAVAPS